MKSLSDISEAQTIYTYSYKDKEIDRVMFSTPIMLVAS